MSVAELAPVDDRSAWRREDFEGAEPWVRPLPSELVDELDDVVRRLDDHRSSLMELPPGRFALPSTAAFGRAVADELETGLGMLVLRGVPVERYSDDQLKYLYWILLSTVGTPLYQSSTCELIGEVRDEEAVRPGAVSDHGGPRTRSYARSTSGLPFHTDRCDVVTLLCVRQARSGGGSRVVSSTAIYNEMLRRAPDLVAILERGLHRSPQGDELRHNRGPFRFPILSVTDGKLTSQYSAAFLVEAQLIDGVPKWTPDEEAALAMHAELAEQFAVDTYLEPGDIQLLNSHVTLHARTGYEDHDDHSRKRLLYRLWLSVPNSRPLRPDHHVLWGRTDAGALRGGVIGADGRVSPFTTLEAS